MKTLETSKTLLVTNRSRMEDSKIKTLINSPLLSGPWCRTWSHNKCIQMQVHVVTAKTNIKTTTNRTNKIKDIRIALTARTHTPTMVRDVVDTSKDKDKATTATKTCKCKSKIQFNPDHNQCHLCQCHNPTLCHYLSQVHPWVAQWASQLNPLAKLLLQVTQWLEASILLLSQSLVQLMKWTPITNRLSVVPFSTLFQSWLAQTLLK